METMFHAGDLNSGISLAIQQQKLVACFVRSDNDNESEVWETQWLTGPDADNEGELLGESIGRKAVLLRIEYGSKEASFLGAFCPITKPPTLVIIHNGQVLEKLESGLGYGEWKRRLLSAVGVEDTQNEKEVDVAAGDQIPATQAQTTAPETETGTLLPPTSDTSRHPPEPIPEPEAAARPQSPPLPPAPPQPHGNVQTLLQERAQRLEIEQQKREAAEKAERTARANARRQEAEEARAAHQGKGKQRATDEGSDKDRQARQNWIYQQKQRKDEAKRERERILNQIESDKQERRARTQRARDAEATSGAGESEPIQDSVGAASRRTAGAGGVCSLQIRLFDGTSVRHRFSTDATLAKNVRDWIGEASPDGSGGADIPYTFRQILAPRPSRSIEISEEHETLADLDLVPNATLVLVPVAGYTDAYASSPSTNGIMGRAFGLFNSVGSYLPGFSRLYMGGTGDAQEASNVEGAVAAGADTTSEDSGTAKLRVKTLADQREEAARRDRDRQAEFYNGNSLGFEGRKNDGEDNVKDGR